MSVEEHRSETVRGEGCAVLRLRDQGFSWNWAWDPDALSTRGSGVQGHALHRKMLVDGPYFFTSPLMKTLNPIGLTDPLRGALCYLSWVISTSIHCTRGECLPSCLTLNCVSEKKKGKKGLMWTHFLSYLYSVLSHRVIWVPLPRAGY